ncbi:MAG TPA: hypothetical protein VF161_06755 [Steroidobacteraceae bacterium]
MNPYYVCLGIAVLVGVARIVEWHRHGAPEGALEAVGMLALIWGVIVLKLLVGMLF